MPSPASVDASSDPARSQGTSARGTGWAVAALALITGVLGVLAVLAPVTVDDPVVSWPRAGQQPTSTVLPLSPYRPLQFRATIPCGTLQTLNARPGGGEALRTLPAAVATPSPGLVVAAARDTVTVSASGAVLVREPLPSGDCTYDVRADATGVRVSRDGAGIAARPDLPVPQVAELQTDAEGAADGLSVQLHTDARYQSSPTPLKLGLLIAHGLALLGLLVLAWRRWCGSGPGLIRPRLSGADAVVVVAAVAWVVLAPINIDDSWYLLMARNAMGSGYIGNAIYQFNVTENPFSTSQYVLQAWGALGQSFGDGGWSLGWMRLVPLAYGLIGYGLLRVLVATVLGRAAARPAVLRARRSWAAVPWAVAAAFLLWWLAYGMTLRPEPLIALGTAAVMVLAELARRRRSVGVLAVATAAAALTVTASPTGLIAVAPLVLCLPWLWQWWRAAGLANRVGAVLLAGAAASVVVPAGFADATLGDVLEATAVHRWYYRQYPWYDEYLHYANLLSADDQGAWAKRLPVLLTLAVLLAVAVAAGRRPGTGGRSGRLLNEAGLITVLGLAAMALTPTKWVNHFGAVAAPATVLVAAALIRSPLPRRAGAAVVAIGTAALVAAAAVGFAGANLWRPMSDWGQPFGNHTQISNPYLLSLVTPSIGPLTLRNPLLWLAIAGLGWWWARRRGRQRGPGPDRAVLITATSLGVVLMLTVFVVAPLRQFPGTSVALMNLRALIGRPCGLAPAVQVLTDTRPGLGPPVGAGRLTGDMRQGQPPDLAPPPGTVPRTGVWPAGIPAPTVWQDHVAVGTGTGTVTTPWYPLPGPVQDTRLVVPLVGDLTAEQRITVQVATGNPADPDQVRSVRLAPAGNPTDWVEVPVALAGTGLHAPTAVRVVAEDRAAGPDSWLALAQPWLTTPRSVTELTAGRPVFADQASAGLWPCQQQIALRDGIAQAPAVRLRAGDGMEGAIKDNSVFAPNGGTLVQVDRTARFVEVPSQLVPPGVPTLGWGHVEEVIYDHPVGLVDLRVEQVRRAGWTRLPTLARESYTGRIYIG
ncbi:MAG: arabinosyltransferase domain-containing protein [Pseudonocardiaceae bacterium]